jgi:hypothetical protein
MNFDKIKVLTFAKGTFIVSQNKLITHLHNIGIKNVVHYSESDLPSTFLKDYKDYFKLPRGFGYWIWKPFIILEEIKKLNSDEILIYIDSTDLPETIFFEIVEEHFKHNNILLVNRGYNHGQWTKRDCFVLMGCDSLEYYREIQLEAGVIGFKKTDSNITLLNEWFYYMKNPNILTDIPNICGLPNLENFQDHRHDQSILTNLSIQKKIKSIRFDNNIIRYNFNQPSKYI